MLSEKLHLCLIQLNLPLDLTHRIDLSVLKFMHKNLNFRQPIILWNQGCVE